jgi:hypothetical protein
MIPLCVVALSVAQKKKKQFLWLSSSGVHMHTHFDQDHNFFVQV